MSEGLFVTTFTGAVAPCWVVTVVVVVTTAAVIAAVVVTAASVQSIKVTSGVPRVDRQCVESTSSTSLITVKRRVFRQVAFESQSALLLFW